MKNRTVTRTNARTYSFLNTKTLILAGFAVIGALAMSSLNLYTRTAATQELDKNMPTLDGDSAVEYLKQDQTSGSLAEAMAAVVVVKAVVSLRDDSKAIAANSTTTIPASTGGILFSSDRDGNNEIYRMNANGTEQTRLTNNPASDGGGKWSPDRTKIAFSSNRDGNNEIYVMNADGSNPVRITNNPASDSGPVWSPDGQKLAFTTDRHRLQDQNFEIYVINIDGTNELRLTNDPPNDLLPDSAGSWSPNGAKIAYTRGVGISISNDIFVMNADGSNKVNLTATTGNTDEAPDWSPDGTKIAFQANAGGEFTRKIAVMDADGQNRFQIANQPPSPSFAPAWSPDGTRVAFTHHLPDPNVWTIGVNGSNLHQLTSDAGSDGPSDWTIGEEGTPTPTPTPTGTPTPTPVPGCAWTTSTAYPIPISRNATVTLGSNVYSFGGSSGAATVANSYRFDGTAWAAIAPLPLALEEHGAVTDGTYIYLVNGSLGNNNSARLLTRYDPVANSYTTTLAQPVTFTRFSATIFLNGKIYRISGRTGTFTHTSTVEVYDIASNVWSNVASYPAGLGGIAAYVSGGRIYAAGGNTNPTGSVKTYVYDPAINTWDDAAVADLPVIRSESAAGFYGLDGVIVGGFAPTITATGITRNATLNSWSSLPDLPSARTQAAGSALGGSFYVIGGNSTTTFNPDTGTTDVHKLTCTAPAAGFEGDVAPRPDGDGSMLSTDVTQLRRFVSGLDTPNPATNENQRADCAPRASSGDGALTSGDVVQGRRYAAGLDPLISSGGPVSRAFVPESIAALFDDVYSYFFGRELRVGEAIASNSTVTVPIEITPNGDEVAVSFTLEYDDTIFMNARIVLGEAVPADSTLTVNTTESDRIGILIDSDRSITASAMPVSILSVTFDVVAKTDQEAAITLTDSLAVRSVSDGQAHSLSVKYRDGVVKLNVNP